MTTFDIFYTNMKLKISKQASAKTKNINIFCLISFHCVVTKFFWVFSILLKFRIFCLKLPNFGLDFINKLL